MTEQAASTGYLKGDVLIGTVANQLQEIRPMIQNGITKLDCSGINQVDSAVLGFLLECKREAGRQGQSLEISNIPDRVLSLASLYGVIEQLAA